MLETTTRKSASNVVGVHQAAELRKRILKLRWIGLEQEAQRLALELARDVPELVLAGQSETD